jgi:hypothetical protein
VQKSNTPDNPPAISKVKFVQPSTPVVPRLKLKAEVKPAGTIKISREQVDAIVAAAFEGQKKAIQTEIDRAAGRIIKD